MLNKKGFQAALKRRKDVPLSVSVLYRERKKRITYLPQDFDKINWDQVRKVTVNYSSGPFLYLEKRD